MRAWRNFLGGRCRASAFPGAWKGAGKLDYALGATLIYGGEGKVDQVTQGFRIKGEFDTNYILFLGGTIRYVF